MAKTTKPPVSSKKIKTVGAPTASDSLALLNSAQRVNKFYADNKYKSYTPSTPPKDVHTYNKSIRDEFKNNKNSKAKVLEKDGSTPFFDRKLNENEYYQQINANQYKQRESDNGILNLQAPMPLYDKRIQPHYQASYLNENSKSKINGDNVTIPMYDELAITPASMLTPEQYAQRKAKYGMQGLPSTPPGQNTNIGKPVHTPVQQIPPTLEAPVPQRPKVRGVGLPQTNGVEGLNPNLSLSQSGITPPRPKGYEVTDTYSGSPFGANKSTYKVSYQDSFGLSPVNGKSTTRTMNPVYFADGGDLDLKNPTTDLNEFNEGGLHEQNPLGGIPQGLGPNGQMNTVEQGETKKGSFVYSDRIQVPEGLAKSNGLPGNITNKSFAEASKIINNQFKDRHDPISTRTKTSMLDKLADAQEQLKAEQEAKQMQIQQALMDNQNEVPDMMNGVVPEGMEEFAKGGKMDEPDPYREWKRKYNLQESEDYNLRRAYELDYTPDEDGHLPTVDSETLKFLKKSNHPTVNLEEDWYNSNDPEAVDFKSKYYLDKTSDKNYWQYKPKSNKFFLGGDDQSENPISQNTGGSSFNTGAAVNAGNALIQSLPEGRNPNVGMSAAKGAASGAAMGTAIMPGWGTAIGAVVGGGIGLIKGKKDQKAFNQAEMISRNKEFTNTYLRPLQNDSGVKTFRKGGPLDQIPPVDGSLEGYETNSVQGVNHINLPNSMPATAGVIGTQYATQTPLFRNTTPTKYQRPGRSISLPNMKFDPENLRYSPVLANAMQLGKLRKPGEESLGRLNRQYDKQYLDESQITTQAREQTAGAINAIGRSGATNGQLINATLAAQLNGTRAIGEGYNNIRQHNMNENKMAQQVAMNNDQVNLQQSNLENDINARNLGAYNNNRAKLISQLGNDIGNIGKEETYKKMAISSTGYDYMGNYKVLQDPKATPAEKAKAKANIKNASANSNSQGGKLGILKFKKP